MASRNPYTGKKDAADPQPAQQVSPYDQAVQLAQARVTTDPMDAQTAFKVATDPNYGIKPFTQFQENVRQEVFPQEQAVRSQLAQNILANLVSPTGISPDQQTAIDTRRSQAQGELVKALRDRANLGGNLFGGRSALDESRQVQDLQNQFSEEDINRQSQARLNAIQGAIPFLQLLFPDVNITQPNFQSSVQNPSTYASSLATQRGQDIQAQTAAQVSQNALYGALFQGLGQTAGGAFAGVCFVSSVIFGGWFAPKTILARNFIGTKAPSWFRNFYIKHGEKIALFICDKPILKSILRPMFELFAFLGRR